MYSEEHALESAKLLNKVQPWMIFLATLFLTEGSLLHRKAQSGEFIENTAGQNLIEELRFIYALEMKDTFLLGLHTSNAVPVYGKLLDEKIRLILELERGIQKQSADFLSSRPNRGAEGRYV